MPLREMELFLQARLTLMELIAARMQYAVYVFGHGAELKTLEADKLADLIVMTGNSLADIRALEKVRLIIQNGQIVYVTDEQL